MIEFIPGMLFTWLAIWFLYAFTTNLLYPAIRALLFALHPATGSTLLFSWISLPAFCASISTLMMFAPAISMIQGDAACQQGGCSMLTNATLLVSLPAFIIGFWLLLSGTAIYLRYWRPAQQLTRQLNMTGVTHQRYIEIASDTSAAFTLGWLSPRIYLTRGLLDRCSPEEIECILNHEEAHLRRKDNLCLLGARLLTAVLPAQLVKRQFDDYRLLCEQACDLEASKLQPADEVASVLLKVAKLQAQRLPGAATAFVGGHVEQRILAIFRDTYLLPNSAHTLLLLGLTLALALTPAALFHFWILG